MFKLKQFNYIKENLLNILLNFLLKKTAYIFKK